MESNVTGEQIHGAIDLLAQSERGRQAMQGVVSFVDCFASGLETKEQTAMCALLAGLWGNFPTTTREAIREALVSPLAVTTARRAHDPA